MKTNLLIKIALTLITLNTSALAEQLDQSNIPAITSTKLEGVARSDGNASTAKLYVGVHSGSTRGKNFQFYDYETIDVVGKIIPAPQDIGKTASIYVVLRLIKDGTETWTALNSTGNWLPWNTYLNSLPAAFEVTSLKELEERYIYAGMTTEGERRLYLGYSTESGDGKPVIHFNSTALKFETDKTENFYPELEFEDKPILVENENNYYRQICDGTKTELYNSNAGNIQFAIPVNINDDNYDDLIVLYWCRSKFVVRDDPTPDLVAAFLSDEDGSYHMDNMTVFGEQNPKLGGMSRKYISGDMNGDGRQDFAFAVNWEDNRFAGEGHEEDNFSVPAIMLSKNEHEYEILNPGRRNWYHAVANPINNLGTNDFFFAGFHANYDGDDLEQIQSYRFDINTNSLMDVTDEYPYGGAGETQFSPDGSIELVSEQERIGDGIFVPAINMYKKENGQWTKKDSYYHEPVGAVDFISFNDTAVAYRFLYNLNGKEFLGYGAEVFCFMEKYDESSEMTFVAFQNGEVLKSGGKMTLSGNGVSYNQTDDMTPYHLLSFFKIIDNKLQLIENVVINEQGKMGGFFMDCLDINKDGFTDISIAAISSDYYDRDAGGVPILYLNDGNGHLVNSNIRKIPGKYQKFGASEEVGYFHDVNNDEKIDLIILPNSLGFDNDIRNEPTADDIYIYLGK